MKFFLDFFGRAVFSKSKTVSYNIHFLEQTCIEQMYRILEALATKPKIPKSLDGPNREPITKLRCEGMKTKLGDRATPLSQGLDYRPPPLLLPYLKIWIRHWFVPLERSLSSPELGLGPTVSSGSFRGRNGLWADLIV